MPPARVDFHMSLEEIKLLWPYESILTRFGTLAVNLAIGEVSQGKTIAAKLVVIAGCNSPRGYLQMLIVNLAKDLL